MRLLSCIFVIIGVIIGAGFASGKEIYTFFFMYQKQGIIGIAISSIIIGYTIYKTMKLTKKYDIYNYNDFLGKVIGEKQTIEIVLNFIVNTFLLITFFVMSAGFSAYFSQEYGINEILSGAIFGLFCYVILNKDMKGIVFLNWGLIPLIGAILLLLGIKAVRRASYRDWNFTEVLLG